MKGHTVLQYFYYPLHPFLGKIFDSKKSICPALVQTYNCTGTHILTGRMFVVFRGTRGWLNQPHFSIQHNPLSLQLTPQLNV